MYAIATTPAPEKVRRNHRSRVRARRAAAAAWADGIADALADDGRVFLLHDNYATLAPRPVERVTVTKPNPNSPANRARRARQAASLAKIRR